MTSSRVILALDVPDLNGAHALASATRSSVGMVKIGLELFVEAGPAALAVGESVGLPVFLDLKLCDIPATIERAVARASDLGVQFLTVHAAGGPVMLERAVARCEKDAAGLQLVAVTVLTSLDASDLARMGVPTDVGTQVERLARLAWESGVRAFVCSPHETARLRKALGSEATLITPGVRPAGGAGRDDQKRTTTAREAVLGGADWVVVGRPIRDAVDPGEAASRLAREVQDALFERSRT